MSRTTHRMGDVFGIVRDIPATYVPRHKVDGTFIESLTRDKHVVVFGSSKQGKTCLRKYNLTEDDHIVVTCSNKWDLPQIHTAILKAAGYTIEQSERRTELGSSKIAAKAGAKLKVPGVGELGGELGSDETKESTTEVTTVALEIDPRDVNDIVLALDKIERPKFVVLEDFHYLSEEAQRDFAVSLKAFHENSDLCFIVVGVWLDENRLIELNGDLAGRVIAVPADMWSRDELHAVISCGEELLNLKFDDGLKEDLVAGCFESVSVVQESCFRICEQSGIVETLETVRVIGEDVDAEKVIRAVVDEQSARYNAFISRFASGFMETELEMYRWLLYPVLNASAEELEEGISLTDINRTLRQVHPRGEELNPGNVTQALKSAASLQVQHGIKPLVLDYHQSARRLSVVDRGFLIWVSYQDKADLLATADLPTGEPESKGQLTLRPPDSAADQ
jgi:hypothetical protein